MEWCNEDSLHLIQEYEKYELLWNPKHSQHYSKEKKTDAWDRIAREVNIGVDEAKKKMSSLLGSLRREKAKGKKTLGTGKGAREVYKTSWFAFKSFAFLMDRNDPRSTLNTEARAETISGSNSGESEYSTQADSEDIDNFQNDLQSETIIDDTEHSSITPENNADNIQETDVIEKIQSANENNFMKPTAPKRKRTRKQVDVIEDPRLDKAFQFLQKPEDPSEIFALHLANKLKQFHGRTRTLVEHAINQVIFDAEMGLYNTPAMQLTSPSYSPRPSQALAPTTTVIGALSSSSSGYSWQDSPGSVTSDYGHSSTPTPQQGENITPPPLDDASSAQGNVPQYDLLRSELKTYVQL